MDPGCVDGSPPALPGAQHSPDSAVLEGPTSETKAFPTDSKERQNEARRAAKAAGKEIIRKKIKKFVEDHCDDCGEDLTSLTPNLDDLALTEWCSPCECKWEDELLVEAEEDPIATNLGLYMFYGAVPYTNPAVEDNTIWPANVGCLLTELELRPKGTAIVELTGQSPYWLQLNVRHQPTIGETRNYATYLDLYSQSDHAEALLQYMQTQNVLLAVMHDCTNTAVSRFQSAIARAQHSCGKHFFK